MLEPIFADDKNRYTRYRLHRLRLGLLAARPLSMRTLGGAVSPAKEWQTNWCPRDPVMKATCGPLAMVVLAAALCGCRMCQSPFDYCNPMIGPDGALNCDFGARRGSVLHPMADDPPMNLVKAVPPQPGTTYEMGVPDPEAERGYDPTAEVPDYPDTFVE